MSQTPTDIIFFTNATYLVFDEEGQQMSELQRSKKLTIEAIKENQGVRCQVAHWGEWSHKVTFEHIILLLGGELTYPVHLIRRDEDGSENPDNPESP